MAGDHRKRDVCLHHEHNEAARDIRRLKGLRYDIVRSEAQVQEALRMAEREVEGSKEKMQPLAIVK